MWINKVFKSRRVEVTFTLFTIFLICIISFSMINGSVLFRTLQLYFMDSLITSGNYNFMTGSSTIALMDAEKIMKCGEWLNRGIGASEINDLKIYIRNSPINLRPKKVFLYAGENDLSNEHSTLDVYKQYVDLIDILRFKFPETEIHIAAIKFSPARKKEWDKFRNFNNLIISNYHNDPRVFIHTSSLNNNMNDNVKYFIDDGIHLSELGYDVLVSGLNESCVSK